MGVFATRSPHRPCPIGLTVAKVGEFISLCMNPIVYANAKSYKKKKRKACRLPWTDRLIGY